MKRVAKWLLLRLFAPPELDWKEEALQCDDQLSELVLACERILIDHMRDGMLHSEYFHNNRNGRKLVDLVAAYNGEGWRDYVRDLRDRIEEERDGE